MFEKKSWNSFVSFKIAPEEVQAILCRAKKGRYILKIWVVLDQKTKKVIYVAFSNGSLVSTAFQSTEILRPMAGKGSILNLVN